MTDMQASVGLAQLEHLDGFIAARRRNFARLKAGLKRFEGLLVLPEATPNSDPSWFGFPISVTRAAPFSRNQLTAHLESCKIGTRLLFGGNLVRQPYMKDRTFRTVGDLAQADFIMNQTFWIGVYPGLGEAEINYVLGVFEAFLSGV